VDFVSIVCYAYVLATLATRAFAGADGLNRYGHAPSRLLNQLGWAPPLMVFADVAENVPTWLTFTLVHNE